jgi:hypothetical protein
MEQAIGHGLTKFKIGTPEHYFNGTLHSSGIKDPALKKRLTSWFLGEISRYMREKGVGTLICTKGDELSLKELKEVWRPWAEKMHAAGWDCSSTFSFWLKKENCPFINEVSEYVKLWTFNRGIAQYFISLKNKGIVKLRPDAVIGTYGAGEGRGSEHRKPMGRSRMLGWESWHEGVQDCQVNPYFKGWLYYCDYGDRGETGGVGGERFVSFIDKNNLATPVVDCPFWEGVRDGMDDGNLAAILSWYIKTLSEAGGGAAKLAERAGKELEAVMGASSNSLIKIKRKRIYDKYEMNIVAGDTPSYKKAKRRVLEILDSLAPAARTAVKPSLYWNDIPLIDSGKPVAAICGEAGKISVIQRKVSELCGMKLPVFAQTAESAPRGTKVTLLVGNGSENAFSAKIQKENKVDDANEAYPGKGGYYIKKLKSDGNDVLLIAGPDSESTAKGAAMFAEFLHSTGFWLRPRLN